MNAPKNPPAFPHVTQSKSSGSNTIYTHVSEGMTLRDWFAGQALSSFAGASSVANANAQQAYALADAMLAERAKASS